MRHHMLLPGFAGGEAVVHAADGHDVLVQLALDPALAAVGVAALLQLRLPAPALHHLRGAGGLGHRPVHQTLQHS